MSALVRSDIKHSLLCWVSITKSVWCENIASFTQATPSKSIWLNKDYILLRATFDKVPLLTMSQPYSPDIFRSSCVETTAFSCCQTKQIVPLDTELLILPWETGQPSLSQPCRFFQSKAESCSRRRQEGWMGEIFFHKPFSKRSKRATGCNSVWLFRISFNCFQSCTVNK